MKKTISFIGCGNMGMAILHGIYNDFNVLVHEKDKARINVAVKKFKARSVDLDAAVDEADIILLAVKPQHCEEVLENMQELIHHNQMVISIAAGITTKYIEKKLGDRVRVIRTMPNLPVQTATGMTAIAGGKYARPADIALAMKIFSTVGKAVIVEEKLINAVTAVSGSGPAYVFMFTEMLINAAVRIGLDKDVSRELVMQTLRGSLKLMEHTKEDPETLREKVTSKGGTTEAALNIFNESGVAKIFNTALMAAKARAKELAR